MEPALEQVSPSVYAVVGPEGATNFTIVKSREGSAALIDADIRRIDEIEKALELTGCAKVSYLIDTHEHFDHTSANFYFAQRGIPVIASAGTAAAMRNEGGPDFERMMKPVPGFAESRRSLSVSIEVSREYPSIESSEQGEHVRPLS
jgi:glyoxylase-like metal-dependent hydrolase (beta-lactamase superfamily II)